MKKVFNYLTLFLLPLLLSSCGEELVSKGTLSDSITTQGVVTMSSESCGGFHYEKPPVDILFVIDNSGSTNTTDFNAIKGQIANTISTISQDFDYHIYIAPLMKIENEVASSYPLIVSDLSTITHPGSYNIKPIEKISPFSDPQGNNDEKGFDRVKELIDANSSDNSIERIFRKQSNLIVVMISTGDDTSTFTDTFGGGTQSSPILFNQKLQSFRNYLNSPLNATVFRFISLVPHSSNCKESFKVGATYKKMSEEIYGPSDSKDLCSGDYSDLFAAVNNSIKKVLVKHKYDHWVINPNDVAINENNIDLKKKLENGTFIKLNQNSDFKLLSGTDGVHEGYHKDKEIRMSPTRGEPSTGIIVELLSDRAKVTYPECIIAKTKSPTEYYGYVALTRKPDLTTVRVEINGNEINQDPINGWSSHLNNDYFEHINIKVPPGPTSPELYQSGYFLKLNGSAIYSNSDTINVYYRPADL